MIFRRFSHLHIHPVDACAMSMPLGAAARVEHIECVACGSHVHDVPLCKKLK